MEKNQNTDNKQDKELAKFLYHRMMSNMKYTLDLEEYSYKDAGRNDPRYKFFKKQLMLHTYDMMRDIFDEFESWGLVMPTEYSEDLIQGYATTPSGGSGFLNTPDFNDWLADYPEDEEQPE